MQHKRLFVRGVASSVLVQVLGVPCSILLVPLVIRSAGVEVYGRYVLISGAAGVLYGISALGVGLRRARFLPSAANESERAKAFYPPLMVHTVSLLVISLLIVAGYSRASRWLGYDPSKFVIWFAVAYFFANLVYSHTTEYLRFTGRISLANLQIGLFSACPLLLILVARDLGWRIDVNLLMGCQGLAAALVSLPFTVVLLRETSPRRAGVTLSEARRDVGTGLPLTVMYVADTLGQTCDRYMLGLLGSAQLVGQYVPATIIGSLALLAQRVVNYVLPPVLMKTLDLSGDVRARRLFDRTLEAFLVVAVGMIAGSLVLGYDILLIYSGREVADAAWAVVPMIACGTALLGQAFLMAEPLKARFETRKIMAIQIGISLANVVFNFGLIMWRPMLVMPAVASTLAAAVGYVGMRRVLRSVWGNDIANVRGIRIAVAAIVMALVVALLKQYVASPADAGSIWLTLALVAIGGVVYAAGLVSLGIVGISDLRTIQESFAAPRAASPVRT